MWLTPIKATQPLLREWSHCRELAHRPAAADTVRALRHVGGGRSQPGVHLRSRVVVDLRLAAPRPVGHHPVDRLVIDPVASRTVTGRGRDRERLVRPGGHEQESGKL